MVCCSSLLPPSINQGVAVATTFLCPLSAAILTVTEALQWLALFGAMKSPNMAAFANALESDSYSPDNHKQLYSTILSQ